MTPLKKSKYSIYSRSTRNGSWRYDVGMNRTWQNTDINIVREMLKHLNNDHVMLKKFSLRTKQRSVKRSALALRKRIAKRLSKKTTKGTLIVLRKGERYRVGYKGIGTVPETKAGAAVYFKMWNAVNKGKTPLGWTLYELR